MVGEVGGTGGLVGGDGWLSWWGWVVKLVEWTARLVECPLAKAVHKNLKWADISRGVAHIQYSSPPQKLNK